MIVKNKQRKRPAVFLDRDGTICKEIGYLSRVEDIVLLPGSVEAIRKINQSGAAAVLISNQSGVARGFFPETVVQTINRALAETLAKEGVHLEGMYYCPHHPDGKPPYNIVCNCRKPAPGQIYRAMDELNLTLSGSVVIGDKWSDVETAQNLNIPGILVLTGYGKKELEKYRQHWERPPAFIAENLLAAVEWWLEQGRKIS